MKWMIYDVNTKWNMTYRTYRKAKGKRKLKLMRQLFEILQANAMVNQFNHNNQSHPL